jgi:serine/threonine protein kinase
MALAAGARLGPYEILSALGAGGMGEVYRALDTTLNREVALKVLPDAFILDPHRLARFKREAQVLASLNHPNIAAIYGFEASNRIVALVLELVDGPTLADRIAAGPISIDEALPIARQIPKRQPRRVRAVSSRAVNCDRAVLMCGPSKAILVARADHVLHVAVCRWANANAIGSQRWGS